MGRFEQEQKQVQDYSQFKKEFDMYTELIGDLERKIDAMDEVGDDVKNELNSMGDEIKEILIRDIVSVLKGNDERIENTEMEGILKIVRRIYLRFKAIHHDLRRFCVLAEIQAKKTEN